MKKVIKCRKTKKFQVKINNISVRIWRCDQDRESSIEQSIVTGANQLSREVENIILTMKVGDVWEIQVNNTILQK